MGRRRALVRRLGRSHRRGLVEHRAGTTSRQSVISPDDEPSDLCPFTDMNRRRACLVIPAAPAAKLAKGPVLAADEVVLALEDAVVPAAKEEARAAVVEALGG